MKRVWNGLDHLGRVQTAIYDRIAVLVPTCIRRPIGYAAAIVEGEIAVRVIGAYRDAKWDGMANAMLHRSLRVRPFS